MIISKLDVLQLYKTLLREAGKFPSYNFRMYALRRIKSRFRENKMLRDPVLVEFYFNDGRKNVDIIKRQVIINDLYQPEKLVIESKACT